MKAETYRRISVIAAFLAGTLTGIGLQQNRDNEPDHSAHIVASAGWGAGECAEDDYCVIALDGSVIHRVHYDELFAQPAEPVPCCDASGDELLPNGRPLPQFAPEGGE
jgi:hypothetical protein